MTEAEFVAAIRENPVNAAILERLPALALSDAWLVSGALFQTVWNRISGRDVCYGIKDYDIFYFDPDTSYEAEDAVIRRCAKAFTDADAEIEVRNQARVHLWYEEKYEHRYPPLGCSTEGIDRFLAIVCKLGISGDGYYRVYAPHGFDDLEAMIVRPNPSPNFSMEFFRAKAARWKAAWPELRILDPFH